MTAHAPSPAEPGRRRDHADDDAPLGVPTPVPRPLARARSIARVMDDSIPVPFTRWRIGLDPLLGLLPGTGDWIGWAIATHVMVSAAQLGAGAPLLLRMFGNILVDAATGLVPILGDVFDAGWKANVRNLRLLEVHVADPARTARASRWRVAAVLGVTALSLVAGAWGVYTVVREVVRWLFGG